MSENHLPVAEAHRRLALIQQLWDELQATHQDPVKYDAIAERLRRQSSAFRQMMLDSHDPKH